MRKLASHLQPSSSVITYDRRGYAHSSVSDRVAPIEELSFGAHVEDLCAMVAEQPSIVFGHSIGGTIALNLASRQPENLLGVVTYESPLLSEPWWPQTWLLEGETELSDDVSAYEERAERFMITVLGENRWNRLPLRTRQTRRAEGRTMIAEMISARWPSATTNFQAIKVPTISAVGQYATRRHREAQATILSMLPEATGVCVRDADHGAHLSHARALAEILNGLARDLGYH